jgi:hypothetical protein
MGGSDLTDDGSVSQSAQEALIDKLRVLQQHPGSHPALDARRPGPTTRTRRLPLVRTNSYQDDEARWRYRDPESVEILESITC